ncbi:glycosyltransferase 61 family protein [Falsiroseomonas ponticola]|uniref:glycosyltransferase 61 family protein n=1 Tax=Falsiroseomonas ponticola TaxID=2786951 RepID=UPI0019344EDE|nr:glycosyltransferase 61 family protein [Roseomonas ponticola]
MRAGQGEQHAAMRIAAFTMVFNEPLFLRLWAAHYGRELGAGNLFCLDHGSTDGSVAGVVANTIRLPRGEFAEVPRANCVSHYQAALLSYYDAVIFSDADEFLVADPARYAGLADFIARSPHATVRGIGCDVVQVAPQEAPLDPTRPILAQRGFARFSPRYCKPLISRVPVTWRPGFHNCAQPAPVDPDLYLFHLKFADAALFQAAQAKRRAVVWSEEAIASHHGGHWRVEAESLAARAFPRGAPADAPELGEAAFRALLAEPAAARDQARLRAAFRIPARFHLSIPALPGAAPPPEPPPEDPPEDPTAAAPEAPPPETTPPEAPAIAATPPDRHPEAERNRALLRAFLAEPVAYDAEPAIEHHENALLLPSLRLASMSDPAIQAEHGGPRYGGTAVDGGPYTAAGAIIRRALYRAGGRIHMPRPDPALAMEACAAGFRTPVTQRGRWVYAGGLHHHFGHFMMESLSRLWAMETLRDWADGIVWTLASPRPHNGARFASVTLQRSYIRDTLRLLGLGEKTLHVVTRPTVFEQLAVPSNLMFNASPNVAAGHAAFRDFVRRMAAGAEAAPLPGLYVSRAGLVAPARFAAEDALEDAFARAGWQVLRPEERSVPEQIALYRAARRLVFAEGSALHLYAYVARPDQRVGIILRRLPAKAKFAQQLLGFGVEEVHVADAVAGIALPEGAAELKGRSAAAAKGATVLDYRRLGDWLVAKGFLSAAEREAGWGELDALPLPAEAPAGATSGPFMVPRATLFPARPRARAAPPDAGADHPFPNPEAAP